MKRFLIVLLTITSLFCLFACSSGSNLTIENYSYTLKVAYKIEDGELLAVAVEKYDSAYPSASVLKVTLTAKDGFIKIDNVDELKTYTLSYKTKLSNKGGVTYDVQSNDTSGYLTLAYTYYQGGEKEVTLVLSFLEYTLYFYAD